MSKEFEERQRVRHRTRGLRGVVRSVDHNPGQTISPDVTYTVKWDDDPQPERQVRPGELAADDEPAGGMGDPAGTKPEPRGRRYTSKGPKPPYPIPGVD